MKKLLKSCLFFVAMLAFVGACATSKTKEVANNVEQKAVSEEKVNLDGMDSVKFWGRYNDRKQKLHDYYVCIVFEVATISQFNKKIVEFMKANPDLELVPEKDLSDRGNPILEQGSFDVLFRKKV